MTDYNEVVIQLARMLDRPNLTWRDCCHEATCFFKRCGKRPNYRLLKEAWRRFRDAPDIVVYKRR
jgi:hypothetical protein